MTLSKELSRALEKLTPISPNWAAALSRAGHEAHMLDSFEFGHIHYNIHSGSTCIVGEALRLQITNDLYPCHICHGFALLLMMRETNSIFARRINKFVTHWNRFHRDKKKK